MRERRWGREKGRGEGARRRGRGEEGDRRGREKMEGNGDWVGDGGQH